MCVTTDLHLLLEGPFWGALGGAVELGDLRAHLRAALAHEVLQGALVKGEERPAPPLAAVVAAPTHIRRHVLPVDPTLVVPRVLHHNVVQLQEHQAPEERT